MEYFKISILVVTFCLYSSQAEDGCRKETLQNIKVDHSLKDLVQKFFNKALQVVVNTDPYKKDSTNLDYDSYGVKSEGYLQNALFSFQSSTKIKNIIVDDSSSTLQFGLDLSIPKFQITGKYKLNFSFLTMLPIYGTGDIGLLLEGLDLSIRTTFKETQNKKLLQMTDLTIKSTLQNSQVVTQNLFDNPKTGNFVGNILTDMLPLTINENQELFALANIGLRALLNSLMCDEEVTLAKIVDVMQHFIE